MDIVVVGKILGIAAYAALEYWLGKTEKVKAGSTVEVLVNVAKWVLSKKGVKP